METLCNTFAVLVVLLLGAIDARGAEPVVAAPVVPIFSEDFEGGRARWRSNGVGDIDPEQRHGGKACFRISDSSDETYVSVLTRFPVKPDSQYAVTFSAMTENSRHGGMTAIAYDAERDAKTRIVHFYFPFIKELVVGEWRTTTRTVVTGPTSVECELRLNPANGNRSHTGTMWFDDIALKYLGPAPEPKPKEDERLKPLPETPPAEESLPLPPLPPLVLDVATLGNGPVLVMGNLTESVLGRKLYLTGYDFTDYAWPGKEGHVVRTVRDPFGTGAHVLMIGGSYPGDIAAAARAASAMVRRTGPRLEYTNIVELGENADCIREWSSKYKSSEPGIWDHIGPLGSWTYLEQTGKAAMGYLRTGDEEYLEHFRRSRYVRSGPTGRRSRDSRRPGSSRSAFVTCVCGTLTATTFARSSWPATSTTCS